MKFYRQAIAAGALATLALILGPAVTTVHAQPSESNAVRSAFSYTYYAGHPMHFNSPGSGIYCTGSWTITGASGSFILTAGHCNSVSTTVYGTGAAHGTVAHRHFTGVSTSGWTRNW